MRKKQARLNENFTLRLLKIEHNYFGVHFKNAVLPLNRFIFLYSSIVANEKGDKWYFSYLPRGKREKLG